MKGPTGLREKCCEGKGDHPNRQERSEVTATWTAEKKRKKTGGCQERGEGGESRRVWMKQSFMSEHTQEARDQGVEKGETYGRATRQDAEKENPQKKNRLGLQTGFGDKG